MTNRKYILSVDINNSSGEEIPINNIIEEWLYCALGFVNHNVTEINNDFELSLRVVDEIEMRALNHEFRNKNVVTNVLSFPSKMNESFDWPLGCPYHLGDIVICASVLNKEAQAQIKTIKAHWCHLLVHGLLHLFDYDHLHDDEAIRMEDLERAICSKLGFADPYK
jgi:probable rRNA maturation factor